MELVTFYLCFSCFTKFAVKKLVAVVFPYEPQQHQQASTPLSSRISLLSSVIRPSMPIMHAEASIQIQLWFLEGVSCMHAFDGARVRRSTREGRKKDVRKDLSSKLSAPTSSKTKERKQKKKKRREKSTHHTYHTYHTLVQ